MTVDQFARVLIVVAITLSVIMAGAWFIWRRTQNSGWVDVTWTFGLGAVGYVGALVSAYLGDSVTIRQTLVIALVIFWSARLGLHIAYRTAGRTDDPRYAKLLREWGGRASQKMFWLLQKQALVSIPLGVSIVLAASSPLPGLRAQDALAVLVLLVAIGGESVADDQLRRFRANPANAHRICNVGLWGWSRHPNYFFEWLGWLAYPLFAIDLYGRYPWGWLAVAGPICMYWLLVHVSGVPPLEAHMLERRGDVFRTYQAQTNVFFPAPPRVV